jgi:competence protein ComEA
MTRFDLLTLAAVGAAALLSVTASLALVVGVVGVPGSGAPSAAPADPWASAGPLASAALGGELVVDVEGGVVTPGVHRLPAGSRVADALAAAGGFAEGADLLAAARDLNLAAPVVDGQQIWVPLLGEGSVGAGGGGADDGLLNMNRATQAELEALPGIGPVTAERIIAARAEQPFGSLDELVAREVLTQRQLDQIADLVTVP